MDHSLSTYSPPEGHLGYFQLLARMGKAVTNTGLYAGFCVHKVFALLGEYQGARLLDHMVRICLVL